MNKVIDHLDHLSGSQFQRIWSAGHGQSVRIEISMRVYPKGPVHPFHPVSSGSPGAGTNHTMALYSCIWMFISIVQLRIVPLVSYLPLNSNWNNALKESRLPD